MTYIQQKMYYAASISRALVGFFEKTTSVQVIEIQGIFASLPVIIFSYFKALCIISFLSLTYARELSHLIAFRL